MWPSSWNVSTKFSAVPAHVAEMHEADPLAEMPDQLGTRAGLSIRPKLAWQKQIALASLSIIAIARS